MSFFVPTTSAFDSALSDLNAARYWRVSIDTDGDGTVADVTDQVAGNYVTGGQRSGTTGAHWTVRLRNSTQTYTEGDLAGRKATIEAKVSTESYITVFTGYVSEKGCTRKKRSLTRDTVTVELYDLVRTTATRRKVDRAIYSGYDIVDTGDTSNSLLHILAGMMGLSDSDIDAGEVAHTVDHVLLNAKTTAWKELQKMAEQYLAWLYVRYDGKLRFSSRFETGWSAPSSEWTFCTSGVNANVIRLTGGKRAKTATRCTTEYDELEDVGAQTVYKNTDDWDSATNLNTIELADGAYWPGPNAGDVAQLKYKNPDNGESYPLAKNVIMPTVGSLGSDSDIECSGGAVSIISFNASTSATQQNADSSEIILKNETGGTIYIKKFKVRASNAYRLKSNTTVKEIDATISDEWEHVDEKLDGTYVASQAQAHEACQYTVEWGKVEREEYDIETYWLPQIQKGATVTFDITEESRTIVCYVESFSHSAANGPMGAVTTRVKLVKTLSFSYSGTPTVNALSSGSQKSVTESSTTDPDTETVEPQNGSITGLTDDAYGHVIVTFTVGDDTHGGTYDSSQVSGLAGHHIYRRLNADGSEVRLVGDVGDETQTTFVDTTARVGTAYDYGIAAYDNNNNVSTISWYGTPITPTNSLNASIDSLAYDAYAQVTVSFTPAADPESRRDGHNIWRRIAADNSNPHIVGTADEGETSFLDETSEDGTGYEYGIQAVEDDGTATTIIWHGTSVTPEYTAVPVDVGSIEATAYPRYIEIEWTPVGGPVGPYKYTVSRSVDGGSTWNDTWQTEYEGTVIKDTIGEVEYSTISGGSGYQYRVKAEDKYGNLSSSWTATGADPTRDESYGTWTPATIDDDAIKATAGNRTIAVAVQTQGYDTADDATDDLIDGVGLRIRISNDGGSNWYEPNFDLGTEKGTDADRWKVDPGDGYADVRSFIIALYNLPLTNETDDSLAVEDEVYTLQFKYLRENGNVSSSWSSSINCTVTATTARDVVQNAIKAKNLDPETFAAINENDVLSIPFVDNADLSDTTRVEDISGQDHHGTLTAGAGSFGTGGKPGTYFDFDGADSVVVVDHHSDFDFAGDLSIATWVSFDNETIDTNESLVAKYGGSSTKAIILSRRSDNEKVQFIIRNAADTDWDRAVADAAMSNDGWHFIVGVRRSGTMYLWIDAVQQSNTVSNSVTLDGTQDITIGDNGTGTIYLDGKMGITRIFSRALSEAEIKALYMIPSGVYGEKIHGVRFVDGTITADAIYTDTLAAITANIGAITNGSLTSDATYNFWNLSTGEWRVGDADNYIYFDPAASTLTMKMDAIYVSTLETRVKGTLQVADSGDIETGLTDPVELYTESSGANAVIEHPTQIDWRINASDIVTINSTGVGIGRTPDWALDIDGGIGLYGNSYSIGGDAGVILYRPTEGGTERDRWLLRVDLTDDASYPYLTNRTPNGKVVIKTGTAAGGSENTHFTIEGGDGTVNSYFENVKLGIGTDSPDGTLHVHTGSAGSVTADNDADDFIIEQATGSNGGMSILTSDDVYGTIRFGSPSDSQGANIVWSYDNDIMALATHKIGAEMVLRSGNNTEAIRIDSSQIATFVGAPILSALTASQAVFTDGSKGLVSNAITGSGNVVMSASPTLTGTITAAAVELSGDIDMASATALISLGSGSNGGPHGLDFYDSDGTVGLSLYYRTGPEEMYLEDSAGNELVTYDKSGNVILSYGGDLSLNGGDIRLNHDGSSFSDDDTYLYFASDAYIHWDESDDYFYSTKRIRAQRQYYNRYVANDATEDDIYGAVSSYLPANTSTYPIAMHGLLLDSTLANDRHIIFAASYRNASSIYLWTYNFDSSSADNFVVEDGETGKEWDVVELFW